MLLLAVLTYLADAVIIGTYVLMSLTGRRREFHWANVVTAPLLLAVEVEASAFPVVPLTLFFGIIGAVGLVHDK